MIVSYVGRFIDCIFCQVTYEIQKWMQVPACRKTKLVICLHRQCL